MRLIRSAISLIFFIFSISASAALPAHGTSAPLNLSLPSPKLLLDDPYLGFPPQTDPTKRELAKMGPYSRLEELHFTGRQNTPNPAEYWYQTHDMSSLQKVIRKLRSVGQKLPSWQ